jgi:hypothetical protein
MKYTQNHIFHLLATYSNHLFKFHEIYEAQAFLPQPLSQTHGFYQLILLPHGLASLRQFESAIRYSIAVS